MSLTLALSFGGAQAQTNAWGEPFGIAGDAYSGGGARVFIPFSDQTDATAFLQSSVFATDDAGTQASLGVGYRSTLDGGAIAGGNLFIDYADSDAGNDFWGIGIGGELISDQIEVRLNGFAPLDASGEPLAGAPGLAGAVVFDASGNAFTSSGDGTNEYPLYRIDGEIGHRFSIFDDRSQGSLGLFAGGYYHWSSEDTVDDYVGISGRFELTLRDIGIGNATLHIGGFARYDDVRDEDFGGRLSLTFPFGGGESNYQDPIYQRVERDVVFATQVAGGPTLAPLTDGAGNQLTGMSVSTEAELNAALADLNKDIIVIEGQIDTTDTVTVANSGLILTGNGTGILDASGHGNDALLIADGTTGVTLRDLTVQNSGDEGVQLGSDSANTGVDNIVIDNVTVNNSVGHGFYLNGVGTVTVRNSTVDGAGSTGIIVTRNTGNSANVLVENNTFRNVGAGSFFTDATADDQVTYRNNVFDTFTFWGIATGVGGPPDSADVVIENNQFLNSAGNGLQFSNGDISVTGNSFSNVDTVVFFGGGTHNIQAGSTGNTASGFTTLCTGSGQVGADITFNAAGSCTP